ncbi:MAG: WD40 repeat domain-containing protein, partial [Deltaproteobacteria bacterium]
MLKRIDWDWDTGSIEIAVISDWQKKFSWVEEPYVSPNGEKIAAIVNLGEGEFNVCVNGDTWETVFDKIW